MIAASTLLAAPAALCLAGAFHACPPIPDDRLRRLPELAALFALALCLPAAGMLVLMGPATSPVLGVGEIGLSVRLDAVSLAMVALVGFLGWVLLRFSATYLRDSGIARAFTVWLCAALAGLLLLATAGHLLQLVLGFLLTGAALSRLLGLFSSRSIIERAMAKHRLLARTGDAALIGGAACLAAGFGTSEIAIILEASRTDDSPLLADLGAGFIALSAVLKSALLPAHVWLRDADSAPIPVAAFVQTLGVGSGIFLAIRMAELLLAAPLALAGIAALGGATALVAGFVAATQAGGRGAHTWSTVSHSGFAMLLCGLGLFPLALLHLAGHTLHRALAILGREAPVPQAPSRPPSTGTVVSSLTIALAIYTGIAVAGWLLGVAPQVLAVGAILILGAACVAAQGSAADAPRSKTRAAVHAALFGVGFLGLQWLAFTFTADALPPVPVATPLDWALMLLVLAGFALAALVQTWLQARPNHPLLRGVRVHVANGFYLDALANRLLRDWRLTPNTKEI